MKRRPIKAAFEELSEILDAEEDPRFVSIGLTYSNYEPSEVLSLLKTIMGESGAAFINAQIRNRVDIEAIRDIYAHVAYSMGDAKLRLLGLEPERDIASTMVTDEVKVWHTLKNSNLELIAKGVIAGDSLLVFQSLRPSLETLTEDVSKIFPNHQLLDTGETFVGVLLK